MGVLYNGEDVFSCAFFFLFWFILYAHTNCGLIGDELKHAVLLFLVLCFLVPLFCVERFIDDLLVVFFCFFQFLLSYFYSLTSSFVCMTFGCNWNKIDACLFSFFLFLSMFFLIINTTENKKVVKARIKIVILNFLICSFTFFVLYHYCS